METEEIDFSVDTFIKLQVYELAFVKKLAEDIYQYSCENRYNLTETEIIFFMDKVKAYCQFGENIIETLKILDAKKPQLTSQQIH